MKATIHLGFEVGTGDAVAIPLRHLAVTGQTQEAGKTTTLEALITRSGLRAVTFITKRGEGSFEGARRIAPYFREQTDWQFVASILEASRGEKLKFERAWIIRASKGARTLADVQHNVRTLMEKAKGMSADVYLTLDAYLDQVVPAIATVKWAPSLDLEPGVNAVDLSDLSVEMQHLVIRSTLNWILEREKGTVVVVPEAWKFIPQGRGTPVKLAAEAFIRQGAALGNYLWLDSQDIGGVEKAILRSVPVWLLGVQREANEIKRTLSNIPAGTAKPKAAEIAQLALGQFFACWGTHILKTYVQPAWMTASDAQAAAHRHATATEDVGRGTPTVLRREEPPPLPLFPPPAAPKEEKPEMCDQHQKLAAEVETLRRDARQAIDANAAATNLFRQLAYAIVRFLPAGSGGGAAAVDEDAIVRRVLAQVPAGGGPVTVTPPEKLRKDFQRAAVERLLSEVAALPGTAKRLLKYLVAVEKRLGQRDVVAGIGLTVGGPTMAHFKTLKEAGLIDVHPNNGSKEAIRERIAAVLTDLNPTADEVEAVYQNVLHAIATGAEA